MHHLLPPPPKRRPLRKRGGDNFSSFSCSRFDPFRREGKKRGEIRPLLNFSPYIILPVLVLVLLRYDEQHIYSTSVKKHALGLPPLTVTIGSLSQRATNREAVERRRRTRGRGTEGGREGGVTKRRAANKRRRVTSSTEMFIFYYFFVGNEQRALLLLEFTGASYFYLSLFIFASIFCYGYLRSPEITQFRL